MNPPSSPSETSTQSLFQQGLEHHRQGEMTEAAFLYQQTLSQNPAHAGAWHFLGVIALSQRNYLLALERIERAISYCATKPVYFNNYGVVLKSIECYHEAKEAFEKAVSLNQQYADAWSNLGYVLYLLNQDASKIEYALNKALTIVPNHPDALSHLAEFQNHCQHYQECAKTLEKLLVQHPNDVVLMCRIAENYSLAKMFDMAVDFLSKAAGIAPNNIEIQRRLGCFYGELGEVEQAQKCFRHTASFILKKTALSWQHLGYSPVYFDNVSQIDRYWERLHCDLDEALIQGNIYDWQTLVREGFTPSFHLPHHDKCCRDVKEKFARLFMPSFTQFQRPELTYQNRSNGKIRIGFLVTPGNEGGFLLYMVGIIERMNHQRFEIILFYNQTTVDHYSQFLKISHVKHITFNRNFSHSVKIIQDAECDMIYYWKVGTDVWNFFLPMCRLAPIQVTSWSTHGTSGLKDIDYYLSFDKAEVPDAQEQYTEQLFLLEEAPTFQPKRPFASDFFSRAELRLPENGAIYFCPHRLSKYHPDYDFYLKGILENDSTGHILLMMGDSPMYAAKFKERMQRNIGDELFKRMIFISKQSPQLYQQIMAASTVLLDSHIYSGGVTSYDAFSYGVPCVTQAGSLLVQRYPLSSYAMMKINDAPVATDRDEYIRTAVRLGTDQDYRQYLSGLILERSDRIFERENAVREFERFVETVVLHTHYGEKR